MTGGAGTRRRMLVRIIAWATVLAVIVAAAWYVFAGSDGGRTITAEFDRLGGVNEGSDVTVLGVPVGSVTGVRTTGRTVEVTMRIQRDVHLSEQAWAVVASPSPIGDRRIDLGPPAGPGPELAAGAHIPVERTAAPLDFDEVMAGVGTLIEAIGEPDRAGALLTSAAAGLDGTGEAFNDAVTELSRATGVMAGRTGDVDAMIEALSTLLRGLAARQTGLDELVDQTADLGRFWSEQQIDVAGPIEDLAEVLDRVDEFLVEHGDEAGAITAQAAALGEVLAEQRGGLAEFVDLAPLLMQNLSGAIGDDGRGRIRLTISTALAQFNATAPLCRESLPALCWGTGLTNPVEVPLGMSDPFGQVPGLFSQLGEVAPR